MCSGTRPLFLSQEERGGRDNRSPAALELAEPTMEDQKELKEAVSVAEFQKLPLRVPLLPHLLLPPPPPRPPSLPSPPPRACWWRAEG